MGKPVGHQRITIPLLCCGSSEFCPRYHKNREHQHCWIWLQGRSLRGRLFALNGPGLTLLNSIANSKALFHGKSKNALRALTICREMYEAFEKVGIEQEGRVFPAVRRDNKHGRLSHHWPDDMHYATIKSAGLLFDDPIKASWSSTAGGTRSQLTLLRTAWIS